MKKIRIRFTDSFEASNPVGSYLWNLLSERYHLELSDDPEYVFAGAYRTRDYLKYDCIKIAVIGENISPDFNQFDYAMGFDYLSFGDRYLRLPLFATYRDCPTCFQTDTSVSRESLLNRKFCSFVVSNGGGIPLRQKFFDALSQYKKVDSGGRYLNNIGMPDGVPDKLAFIGGYKFNIAFENSAYPGYTTEKIMQPLCVHSVPIYWGNPLVARDFASGCFIHLKEEKDIESIIERIKHLDTHDDEYLKVCCSSRNDETARHTDKTYREAVAAFLSTIIDTPYASARRLTSYGMQPVLRREIRSEKQAAEMLDRFKRCPPIRLIRKAYHTLKRA